MECLFSVVSEYMNALDLCLSYKIPKVHEVMDFISPDKTVNGQKITVRKRFRNFIAQLKPRMAFKILLCLHKRDFHLILTF